MRTTSGKPDDDFEQWISSELRSGMDRWDPGPAHFDRVQEARQKHLAARRRHAVGGSLAVLAAILLVFTLAPPGHYVAARLAAPVVGVRAPSSAVSRAPTAPPTDTPTATVSGSPPQAAVPPSQPRRPQPTATPAPAPGSRAPAVTGGRSPGPAASPSPTPTPTPEGICLLGLICIY